MDPAIQFRLLLLVLLLFLSAFFSGSETSLFSLSHTQLAGLRRSRGLAGRLFRDLLGDPRKFIITILIGNELVNIAASITVTGIVLRLWGPSTKYLAVLVAVLVLLIFGEITPKTVAVRHAESLSMLVLPPLALFSRVIYPIRWVLRRLVDSILRALGVGSEARVTALTEEEFKTLVRMGEEAGVLEEGERRMIHRVFELSETKVSEILTPRGDMHCVEADEKVADFLRSLGGEIHARVPVYKGAPDNIVGVLYVKDLLQYTRKDPGTMRVQDLMHPPFFVPSTKRINELLREFQERKIHLALVLDEYGGVEGIVTLEDVLEELVGEITDEFDEEEEPIRALPEGGYLVSAMVPLDEFAQVVGVDLPTGEFDTVGGFVFHLVGSLPQKGQAVSVDNLVVTIEKMRGLRILAVKVEKREGEGWNSQ